MTHINLNICLFIFAFRGVAVKMVSPLFDCPSLNGVMTDRIFLQNLPSIVVGHVVNPRPGSRVLDMCAAPGISH